MSMLIVNRVSCMFSKIINNRMNRVFRVNRMFRVNRVFRVFRVNRVIRMFSVIKYNIHGFKILVKSFF